MLNNIEDNQSSGFIALYRSIRDHWIWEDPKKYQWWTDILLEVNWKDKKVNIGNDIILCKRSQSIKSLSTWAKRWGVSKDTVRNFFKLLEKDKMIQIENVRKSTRITVCNYDSYSISPNDNRTIGKRLANDWQTQTHPNNKGNKDNKENKGNTEEPAFQNSIMQDFDTFYKKYDKDVGKQQAQYAWSMLSPEDKQKVLSNVEGYVRANSDKFYRVNPAKYLNERRFEDELIAPDVDIKGNPIDRAKHPDFPADKEYHYKNIYYYENGKPELMT